MSAVPDDANPHPYTTGRASEGGHWYARDGSCVYEIEMKTKPGQMRAVDLRDARKLGLVPGFSSIAQCEHKPQLEKWKLDQMLMAAITLPRPDPTETDTQFAERVRIDAAAQAEKARERGTALHAALQGYYEGKLVLPCDAPYVWPVVEWLNASFPGAEWQTEQSFAHPLGYGGKCDLRSVVAVVDFKFKDFDHNGLLDKYGKPKRFAYDEHEMQLHAYEAGFGMMNAVKLNLFISSTVPGLIVPHLWPTNPSAFEAFRCLLRLWQIRKHYNSSWT